MAIGIETSRDAVISSTQGVLFSFAQSEAVNTFKMTNTTDAIVVVTIWFHASGTDTNGKMIANSVEFEGKETIPLTGSFNPTSGGSFTAVADVDGVIDVLMSSIAR